MAVERFPIEEGHIAAFARSLGDTNPAWYGPDAVAPPTFVFAAAQWDDDFVLRPKPGQPWMGSGREATGTPRTEDDGSGTQLHAEQHFTYARPVRAGDVLTATQLPGRTWEKEGRRSGKLFFTEWIVEYRDEKGELVVTERGVGVRTEKPVES